MTPLQLVIVAVLVVLAPVGYYFVRKERQGKLGRIQELEEEKAMAAEVAEPAETDIYQEFRNALDQLVEKKLQETKRGNLPAHTHGKSV